MESRRLTAREIEVLDVHQLLLWDVVKGSAEHPEDPAYWEWTDDGVAFIRFMAPRFVGRGHGKMKRYLWNILIGVDQLANTFVGGDPDETLSSRCGKRVHNNRFCRWVCNLLHRVDKRHCERSIEADEGNDASLR